MFSVLRKNLPLKILSVVLAVFLWAVISSGRTGRQVESSVPVPIELHDLPPDLEIMERPVDVVDVRLRGPRKALKNGAALGLNISLDLSGTPEGETTFELFASDVIVPPDVTVTRISPSTVKIVLERSQGRTVPIEATVQGRPARGHRAGPATVQPPSVEVRGPRSLVGGLASIRTSPVILDGAKSDVVSEVNLIVPDERMHLVNRPLVVATVPVRPAGGG